MVKVGESIHQPLAGILFPSQGSPTLNRLEGETLVKSHTLEETCDLGVPGSEATKVPLCTLPRTLKKYQISFKAELSH